MRTTVELDTAAAVEQLRREHGRGVSEAVDDRMRRGLTVEAVPRRPFRQRTRALGMRGDVSNSPTPSRSSRGADAR